MKLKARKGIIAIGAAVMAFVVGLGVLSISHNAKSKKEFVADGFILDAPAGSAVTEVNQQHYFSQGTKYQEKYGTKVLFKDANGENVSLDISQFIHYADGSLGSFSKGVIMNLDDVEEAQFGYYSLTSNTILVKNGASYEMASRGEKMTISEFVWKISDTDYMIVSPKVTLKLSASQEITLSEYAQLKYVDTGIVRIIHQQGTYQTVSADSFLYTEGGAELNLVGKNFYQNGEPGLSLDSMALDDDDYIELDENTDSPELKIPTFNVINGKDGAAGMAGQDGEQGEDGEIGEDGAEGDAGEEGMAGAEGNLGRDGVEGDSGIMGYDGAEGKDGESAENSADDIISVDINARPTVSVDTAENYEVTPGSVKMDIKINDSDDSWVRGEGTTTVDIIDRNTMQSVLTEAQKNELGNRLEQSGNLSLDQNGLRPGTEYIIVVNGKYVVEKDGAAMEGTFFSKVFKTDELGIAIEKDVVTDSSVSVKTVKSATNVKSYSVHFFVYDENAQGGKKTLGQYNNITGNGTWVFDASKPSAASADNSEYRNIQEIAEGTGLDSNSTYYAEIANVKLTNDELITVGDTAIELQTLKKRPYYKVTDGATGAVSEKSVTAVQPKATLNAKNHAVVVSLDKPIDEDNGITGYRYELYRLSEYNAAAANGSLSDLKPAFTKEVADAADQTFHIPQEENGDFIARVVILFRDNEKEAEYSTLFSDAVSVSSSTAGVVVQFVDVQTRPDMISGNIKIEDSADVIHTYISDTYPLLLTITSEWDDVVTLRISAETQNPSQGIYYYHFEQKNLRKNTAYTLSVSGPWDTDGSGVIETLEDKTYMAGYRVDTTNTSPLSVAFKEDKSQTTTAAFAQKFYLTNPVTDTVTVEEYKYEAGIMDYLEFELIHITAEGIEEKLGDSANFRDSEEYQDLTHDSVFGHKGWVEREKVETVSGEEVGLRVKESAAVESHNMVLTPASFGLDNNDSRFFSGGSFKIRAVVGKDYTPHENEIPFLDGENSYGFEISKRHVQSIDPNSEVEVSKITNAGAKEAYKEDGKAEDTQVGIRFKALYPYKDAQKIIYYIYEVNETGLAGAHTIFTKDNPGGELILTGEQSVGQSGGWTVSEVELYFEKNATVCEGAGITWKKPDGTVVSSSVDQNAGTKESVLKRGKTYYIRYEVEADWQQEHIDCGKDEINDLYPNCAYGEASDATNVPFYRSPLIEIEKQTPQVTRYPYTSDEDSVTWMYDINDPDNAIDEAAGFILKQHQTAAQVAAQTGSKINGVNVADYKSGYQELKLPNLTSDKYYSVTLKYQLSSSAQGKTITSAPVQFKKTITADAVSNISCKGVSATVNTLEENKVTYDGKTYEKAFINEGGYRYRLTLQGNDVKKYAAYRIELIDTNNASRKVVYDPVYPSSIGQMSDGSAIATLYMDTAPVKTLAEQGVAQVKISVTGYYTTYESGMKDYTAQIVNAQENTLKTKGLYALKLYQTEGEAVYRRVTNGNWTTSQDAVASFLLPGDGTGLDAFSVTDAANAKIRMRYLTAPLSVTHDGVMNREENVTIDENGMRIVEAGNTSYIMMEKLAEKEEISFPHGDHTVDLGDILPAVQKETITPGGTSVYMKFKTLGTGAAADSKIYAKVYCGNTLLKVEKKQAQDGTNAYYYEVVKENNAAVSADLNDYKKAQFEQNFLPIQVSDGNISAELRIRGLERETSYRVVFFAYNSNGEIVELYSLDGRVTGYPYEFKTLKSVQIDVEGPNYIYTTYTNKSVQFRFRLPGDEGTGKTIYYKVLDGNNREVVPETKVEPLGSGDYTYYSQNYTDNHPIELSMTPATGLKLNTAYKLIVYAMDKVDPNEGQLGEKETGFQTPASLAEPEFNITATAKKTEQDGKVDVEVTIVSTDANRSIMNDTYTVALYDENQQAVTSYQTVIRDAVDNHAKVVTFQKVPSGKEYVVKVEAQADTNNDGVLNSRIIKEYTVAALANTKATITTAASKTKLQLLFTNLQEFDSVTQIKVTVYHQGDYSQVLSQSITVNPSMVSTGEISAEFADPVWKPADAGKYPIYVQYYNGSQLLGNDNAVILVSENTQSASLTLLTNREEEKKQSADTKTEQKTDTEETEIKQEETGKEETETKKEETGKEEKENASDTNNDHSPGSPETAVSSDAGTKEESSSREETKENSSAEETAQ